MLKLHKSLSLPDNLCVLSCGSKGLFLKASTLSQNRASLLGLPAIFFLKALLNDVLNAISIIQEHLLQSVRITCEFYLIIHQFGLTAHIALIDFFSSLFNQIF